MRVQKCLVTLLAVCAFGAVTVRAQTEVPPLISIIVGQNIPGEITTENPVQTFGLTAEAPTSVEVQVLAISQGFVPSFRVLDANGLVIQSVPNTEGQTTARATVSLTAPGQYLIEVQGANGATGQYLLSTLAGRPVAPPQPLVLGEAATGEVSEAEPLLAFTFSGLLDDFLFLTVETAAPTLFSSPTVILRNADTGEMVAASSAQLAGLRLRLPPEAANYVVEVLHSAEAESGAVSVCLEAQNSPQRCSTIMAGQPLDVVATEEALPATPLPVATGIPLPTLPQTGDCVLATGSSAAVNIRSGPGLDYGVVGQLSAQEVVPVIGGLPDSSWWQITASGVTGWVAASVSRVGGDCSSVPTVTPAPDGTQPAATATATATSTVPAPASTDEVQPFTSTPTITITPTFTATSTATTAPGGTLNFGLAPVNGSTALASGFVPDPFSVGTSVGGPVNVNYLGGGCSGYATSAPTFRLNYTSGAFPTLRFYFVGNADATMVVNTPGGSYFCVDDSFGTLHPTMDFNSPSSGAYDIWIGSYASNTSVSGTLYITESTANHP